MQIIHLDFTEDIFQRAVNSGPSLYLADDERAGNLELARKSYQSQLEPLTPQSEFISLSDFKEMLLATGQVTLREEKLAVILYELLTGEEKNRLRVDSYNDIIDLASRFHRFYQELADYQLQVNDLPELEGWRREKFQLFQRLRERYLNRLAESGFTDVSLEYSLANFSPGALKQFDRVVLLNIIELTPLEKELLREVDKHLEVELYLQLPPGDFDRADLEFTGLTLEKAWPGRLEPGKLNLYTAEEDTLQLLSALKLAETFGLQQTELLTPRCRDAGYQRLLSPARVEMTRRENYSRCQIYRFLKSLYQLLAESPQDCDDVRLTALLYALGKPYFRKYFQLPEQVVDQVRDLLKDNYLYLDSRLFSRRVPSLQPVLAELKKLKGLKKMKDLIDYLDQLDFSVLSSSRYLNDVDQLYDGMLELAAIEDLGLVADWTRYYQNPARGLLDRLLQYLEFKQLKPLPETARGRPELKLDELLSAPHRQRQHLLVLNASTGWLPASFGAKEFLLTEEQREEIGLPTPAAERRAQRYYFLRHLLTAERAGVLALENQRSNESPGAFLEELKLREGLEYQQAPAGRRHYRQFFASLLAGNTGAEGPGDRKTRTSDTSGWTGGSRPDLPLSSAEEIAAEEGPLIEAGDFPSRGLNLGFYSFKTLRSCYFRFLCQELFQLTETLGDFDSDLNALTFGSLVHDLAEGVLNRIGANGLKMERNQVAGAVDQVLDEYRLKIDHRFKKYYQLVVREALIESLLRFPEDPESPLRRSREEIKELKTEFSPPGLKDRPYFASELVDFYLTGRLDLLLETETESIIVDFKSSSSIRNDHRDQLNYYALLLREGFSETKPIHKFIYLVLENIFAVEPPGSELEFGREVKEELTAFVDSTRYTRDSSCRWCSYTAICRGGDSR